MRRSRCCSRWLFSTFQLSGSPPNAHLQLHCRNILQLLQFCRGKPTRQRRARAAGSASSAAAPRATSKQAYEVDA